MFRQRRPETLPRWPPQLKPEVAAVLAYEVLLGQGCKKSGPAERAMMGAKVHPHPMRRPLCP